MRTSVLTSAPIILRTFLHASDLALVDASVPGSCCSFWHAHTFHWRPLIRPPRPGKSSMTHLILCACIPSPFLHPNFHLQILAPFPTRSTCDLLHGLVTAALGWTRASQSSRRSTRERATRSTAQACCSNAWWTPSGLGRRAARVSMTIRASEEPLLFAVMMSVVLPRRQCGRESALSTGGGHSNGRVERLRRWGPTIRTLWSSGVGDRYVYGVKLAQDPWVATSTSSRRLG